jgi:hypothetical protein
MKGPCNGAGRLVLPALALALLCLTACAARPGGTGSDGGAAGHPATGGIGPADDLTVEMDPGDGSAVQRWTLVCGGAVEGTHPAAQDACDHLRGMHDPFAPIPDDMMCTEQYDGPQTAHVTGRWDGEPVDLRLARNDGCRIAQWNGLGPLLPS